MRGLWFESLDSGPGLPCQACPRLEAASLRMLSAAMERSTNTAFFATVCSSCEEQNSIQHDWIVNSAGVR